MRVLLGMICLLLLFIDLGRDCKSSWRSLPSSASLVEQTANASCRIIFSAHRARLPIVAEDGRVDRTIFMVPSLHCPRLTYHVLAM